jgi:hypothetical protein
MLRDRLTEIADRDSETPWLRITPGRLVLVVASVVTTVAAAIVLLVPIAGGDVVDVSNLRFAPLATEAAYEGFGAWSPSGEVIAYAAEVGGVLQIFTRRLSSSKAIQVTFGNFDAINPFWSHDGSRIYYLSQAQDKQGIWSIGASGGTPENVVRDAIRGAISPDGSTIAFLRTKGSRILSALPGYGCLRPVHPSRGAAKTWRLIPRGPPRSATFGSWKARCRFRPMALDSGSARWRDRLNSNRRRAAGSSGLCR